MSVFFFFIKLKKRRTQAHREWKRRKRGGGGLSPAEGEGGCLEDMRIPPQCFGGINILLIFTMPEVPAGMPVSAEPM